MQKIKRRFPAEYYLINDVLMEWNPIEVPKTIVMDEYVSYIPRIMKTRKDHQLLLEELKSIIIDDIGMWNKPLTPKQISTLESVAEKLISIK